MHRTQVYLDEELVARLQRLARHEGTSMAELVRRAAWRLVQDTDDVELWGTDDSIWRLLGAEQGGPSESTSSHVDSYLYDARTVEMARRRVRSPRRMPQTT